MSLDGYMFPELSWRRRGSSLNTVVDHGLMLREKGRWLIPTFQRPLVWTVEQKTRFMESLIYGLPIGEYTLHRNKDYTFDVIDGQQRWHAIFSYVDNEYPVFGYYYNDLNDITQLSIGNIVFPHRVLENMTEDEKLEAYNRLAYGGTAHEVPEENPIKEILNNLIE